MKKNESWSEFMDRARRNGVSPTAQEKIDREKEQETVKSIAHEIWATAQLIPGEGIEDGVARVEEIIVKEKLLWI